MVAFVLNPAHLAEAVDKIDGLSQAMDSNFKIRYLIQKP